MESTLKPRVKARKVFNPITNIILAAYVLLIIAGGISAVGPTQFMSPDLYSILTVIVIIVLFGRIIIND